MVEALRVAAKAPWPAAANALRPAAANVLRPAQAVCMDFAPQAEVLHRQEIYHQLPGRSSNFRPLGANTALFARAPRVTDIVQGPERSCALHASAQALLARRPGSLQRLLHDPHNGCVSVGLFEAPQDPAQPWRQVHQSLNKSVPNDRRGAAPWWRLIERSFAVRQGHCDDYLMALGGIPAYRHFCDLHSAAYTLHVLLLRRQLGTWQVSCLGLSDRDAACLEDFLSTQTALPAALAATFAWQAPCSAAQLEALLATLGLRDPALRAALCGAATAAEAIKFLERCMQEKLRGGAAMCFATRPAGAPGSQVCLGTRLVQLPADLWVSLRRRGYLALRVRGQVRSGLLCEHAYAVLGMRTERQSGALQLQLREPLGKLGSRSVRLGLGLGHRHRHWHCQVPQTQATFWMPAAEVLQNAITLYFTA